MAQLRTIQEEKESGNWNNLPEQQREEKETSLRRTGQTARFMNIMGMKTVNFIRLPSFSNIQQLYFVAYDSRYDNRRNSVNILPSGNLQSTCCDAKLFSSAFSVY